MEKNEKKSKYVESVLQRNETVIKVADRSITCILGDIILGVLFCWLIFPPICAIISLFHFLGTELAVTSKRVVGKCPGKSLDAPLDKIQSVSVTRQNFWGMIFGYKCVNIFTAAGEYHFGYVRHAEEFKNTLMAQIDAAAEEKIRLQAEQMAAAMASSMKAGQ